MSNVSGLESLLEALEALVDEAEGRRVKWRDVWSEIRNIGQEFKKVRFPTTQERQEAWDRFQSIITDVKERQEQTKNEADERFRVSEFHLDEINSYAWKATPSSASADAMLAILTGGITSIIKAGIEAILGPFDERKYELQKCREALKAGWAYFSSNKGEMLGKHKKQAFESLSEAAEALDSAWESWKKERQDAIDRFHDERRAEKEAKHEAWETRMRENLCKLEDRLDRLESALSHRRNILSDLEDKRSSAWSDSYIDKVDSWISEEEDRISEIENKIDQVKNWISDIEAKLVSR